MAMPAHHAGGTPSGSPGAARRPRREGSGAAAPAVVAVVVTEGHDSLEATLAALVAQDYPSLTVLVVDRGRSVGREHRRERIAAVAPAALVRHLDRHPDPVTAANDVLTSVEGAPFVCFVADDVEPEPRAIRLLVEEAFRSNAAVCGPKIVDRADPDVLLEVGPAIDHAGVVHGGVEPGERDQEQHDAVRDTFFVSGALMLVRADLFTELGGFDPECAPGHEDIDLCWRAHLLGARVMVVPDARVRRDAAAHRRFGTEPAERAEATRRRVRTLRKNYSVGALVWILPLATVLNLGEVLGHLAARRAGLARATLVGFWSGLLRAPDLRAARAAVQQSRRVDDRDVRAYMARGSAQVRQFAARRRHRSAFVDTAEGRIRVRAVALRRALRSYDVWIALVVTALVLFGTRSLVNAGIPATGGFQRWTSTGDLLGAWGGRWRATGLGAPDPGTPLAGLAGLWSALWLGKTGFAQVLVIVGAAPLGLVGVYRLTRRLSPRALPAAGAVVAYAANPVLRNAYANTRLDALVVFALAPFVLARLVLLIDGATGAVRRRALAGLVLLVALGAAVTPAFALLPALVAVAVTMTLPIVADRAGVLRSWGLAAVAVVASFVLLMPWSIAALGDGTSLGFVPRRHPDLWSVVAFRTGPAGAGPWVWCILLAALLPLVVATERRFAWALRGWTLAIAAYAVVAATGRSLDTPSPALEVLLVPAALGLALAIGIGLSSFFGDIRTFVFGPRQLLALVLAGATALPVVGLLPDVFDGGFDAPTESWTETLAFFDRVAADDGAFRIAWVGAPEALPVDAQGLDGRGVAYAVTRSGSGDLRDLLPPAPARPEATLEAALDLTREGRTARLGHALAPMGVRYLAIVDRSAPDAASRHDFDVELASRLEFQLDLSLARRVDGIALYENAAWVAPRALLGDDLPAAASEELTPTAAVALATRTDLADSARTVRGPSSDLDLETDGRLHLAERADDAWKLATDGRAASRVVSLGWANGFDAEAGAATLEVERSPIATLVLAVPLLGAGAALALARRRRGEPIERALAVAIAEVAPPVRPVRRRPRSRAADPEGTTMQADTEIEDADDLAALAALAAEPVAESDDVDWSVLAPDDDLEAGLRADLDEDLR